MIGRVSIKISNQRNSYKFTLNRNITILRGDSGTGKTTLYDMIRDYNNLGRESGVKISGGNIVTLEGRNWEDELDKLSKKIVVIDEGSKFVFSKEFANKVKGCDNYFLIITRSYLSQLLYSVDEIYRIKGIGKNKEFERVYTDIDKFYDNPDPNRFPFMPDIIITEDSKSGYEFFLDTVKNTNIKCEAAGGKSKIKGLLKKYKSSNIIIVADGAAIGCEMESLVKEQELSYGKLTLFLPESFEWLILKSGIFGNSAGITDTYVYTDSKKYESWEQYFTDLLMKLSEKDVYKKYSKGKLPLYYIQPDIKRKIMMQIAHIKLDN
jgi:hypothetical protein